MLSCRATPCLPAPNGLVPASPSPSRNMHRSLDQAKPRGSPAEPRMVGLVKKMRICSCRKASKAVEFRRTSPPWMDGARLRRK